MKLLLITAVLCLRTFGPAYEASLTTAIANVLSWDARGQVRSGAACCHINDVNKWVLNSNGLWNAQEEGPGLSLLGGVLGGAKAGESSSERRKPRNDAEPVTLGGPNDSLYTALPQVEELRGLSEELSLQVDEYEQQRQVRNTYY